MPAPEADPLAFETQFEPSSTLSRKDRWRTAGTLTVGLGMALLVLLSFTGNGDIGFAVGGAFVERHPPVKGVVAQGRVEQLC